MISFNFFLDTLLSAVPEDRPDDSPPPPVIEIAAGPEDDDEDFANPNTTDVDHLTRGLQSTVDQFLKAVVLPCDCYRSIDIRDRPTRRFGTAAGWKPCWNRATSSARSGMRQSPESVCISFADLSLVVVRLGNRQSR